MRNIFKIALLIFSIILVSCSEETIDKNPKILELTFEKKIQSNETQKSKEQVSYEIVKAEVIFIDNIPKLISDKISEIEITNENGESSFGYILKEQTDNYQEKTSKCDWKVEKGYGFDGRCFVMGTFYHGTNCETIFVPCGVSCITFVRHCPGENEAYAKSL